MTENGLRNRIMKYLDNVVECFVYKTMGTGQTKAGTPDLLICYKGRFIAIELKVRDNKPTKLQEYRLKEIRNAGGIADVAYSIIDVKNILHID